MKGMKNQRLLERARVEINKLLKTSLSARENLQSIPGWRSIDLADVVMELVEECVADGESENDAFELVCGRAGALEFWFENNDGTFNDIRQWMYEFYRDDPAAVFSHNKILN
jgi:hypothetical protein